MSCADDGKGVEKRATPNGKVKFEDDGESPTPRTPASGTGTGRSEATAALSPASPSSPKSLDGNNKLGSRRTSPLVFWLLLAVGCFQIFLYHPDIVANPDDHWFDQQSWKVSQHYQRQRSSNRTRTSVLASTSNGNLAPPIVPTNGNGRSVRLSQPLPNAPQVRVRSVETKNASASDPLSPLNNTSDVAGNNPIMKVLVAAGLHNVERKDLDGLPSPEILMQLYGHLDEPVVVGMDTCAAYRNQVPPSERVAAVAGMFNTGTNAMAFHLHNNIHIPSPWQVPWGKHRMEFVRLNHTAEGLGDVNKTNVLPIVLIRDPFYWMQSMCKSPYAAHWLRRPAHCPNLVPDETDRTRFAGKWTDTGNDSIAESFGVTIHFDKRQTFSWKSLVHLWNDWYRLYLQATYPRLMFRFEDLLFHGPAVMKRIAECAGVTVPDDFKFQTGSAKSHGSHATFLDALKKTGDVAARLKQLTAADLDFAARHLDAELMRTFHYTVPSSTATQ